MRDYPDLKAWKGWLGFFLYAYTGVFIGSTCSAAYQKKAILWPDLLFQPLPSSLILMLLLMGHAHYRWHKQHQPEQWSKESFVRYLLPLTGACMVLFLEVTFTVPMRDIGPRLLHNSADFGFQELPLFYTIVLHPATMPLCKLFLCGLFFGSVIPEKNLWRAILLALAFILVVAFSLFWTCVIFQTLLHYTIAQSAATGR